MINRYEQYKNTRAAAENNIEAIFRNPNYQIEIWDEKAQGAQTILFSDINR